MISSLLAADVLNAPTQTLAAPVVIMGRGLHTDTPSTLRLEPVTAAGWWFCEGRERVRVEALRRAGVSWATTLAFPAGGRLMTVEHVLGALSGLGVGAVAISIEGGEAPAMDGSALPLVEAIEAVGLRPLDAPQPVWRLKSPLEVVWPEAPWRRLCLRPAPRRAVKCTLRFDEPIDAACCSARWDGETRSFRSVAAARTFTSTAWLPALEAAGLAKGGSLANAVVFDRGRLLNPEGLRSPDEPAKHKILDLIGDLSVLGRPLIADIDAVGPGHGLNARLVDRLLAS